MGFSIDVLQDPNFILRLLGLHSDLQRRLASALYMEAERLMTESKEVYVPVDTGTLRTSGHVEPIKYTGKTSVEVSLGYGGPAAFYALEVHENLNAHHVVGMAKYLETPVRIAVQSGTSEARILAEMNRASF
jgi:hypothetical protein